MRLSLKLALILSLFVVPCWADITVDAKASKDLSAASSQITTDPFSTTAGNELLLAFIGSDSSTTKMAVTSVTGGGLTWELVARSNGQSGDAEIWRALTPAPLSNVTVTALFAQNIFASIQILSFSGVDTSGVNGSGAIGAISVKGARSGAPSASLITTRANSLVIGVGNDWDKAISRTPGAGQTLVHQDLSTSNSDTYWVQRQNTVTAASGTTVTINDTAPTTDRFNLAICEILAPNGTDTPSIGGVSPNQGSAGSAITITGSSFGAVQGSGGVRFNGLSGTILSWSPASITAVVPYGAVTGAVAVTAGNGITSNGAAFTVVPTGAGIAIDANAAGDLIAPATQISSQSFSTSVGNELLLAFIATDSIANGITVNQVSGGGLTWTLVKRTNQQSGDTEIWRAFASSTLSNVSVSATLSQSVVASMQVLSFTGVDTSGANGAGAIGAVAGGNGTRGAPSASLTTTRNNSWVFAVGNDWDNSISRLVSPGQIVIHEYWSQPNDTYWVQRQNNAASLSGTTVTMSDSAPTTDRFNLSLVEILPSPGPAIGSVSPNSDPSGAMVTITGSNFGASQGTSTITFGGVAAVPNSWSDTKIVVPVPAGLTFGSEPAVITTAIGASNPGAFTAVAPLAVAASATPAPNANGWNNTPVVISYQCTGGVPPIQCPVAQTVSADGANQLITATAVDVNGNTANVSTTLNIDRSAPAISASVSPTANAANWNNTNVSITFICDDVTSGVAVCPLPVIAGVDGANQIISGQAKDVAGNMATASITLNIDKTPPTISSSVSPAPNSANWNNSDVTITSVCNDSLSGIATCPSPATVSTEGRNQSITGSATDIAGNTATISTLINLDKTPPTLSILSPASGAVLNSSVAAVNGSVSDALSGLAGVLCNGVPATISGTSFSCSTLLVVGTNSIKVKATDIAGNPASATTSVTFVKPITITSPSNLDLFNQSPVNVAGTVNDPAAQVSVNGIAAPVSGNTFLTTVPLQEGTDTITAVTTNSDGTTSTTSIQVTLDTTPPHVAIYSPPDLFMTTDSTMTVTGMVNDIVVGTVNPQQATVSVNGIAADVSNRSFTAASVPLSVGQNVIRATAVDRAGNSATFAIVVVRQAAGIPVVKVFSGNGQSGAISTTLPQPLVAQLLDRFGNPVPNAPVVFRVTAQDGTLATSTVSGQSAVTANTDTQGLATAQFTLGTHVGSGNNLVEASATGLPGTAIFSASATATAASLIVADSGNDQSGATETTLPLPFIAVVTDSGNNRIPNVPVTFTVIQGNGSIAGQASLTVNSDPDGRVEALLTLGPHEGINNNVVQANFPGNPGFPVTFTATGRTPGPAAETTVSGVVVDNSNQPIPGVTMRMFQLNRGPSGNLPQPVATPAQTNDEGQFVIQPAPVGAFKLMADGGTASRGGPWPTLEYDIVTVSGRDNFVGSPIYLPQLNPANQVCVSDTVGGTLTIPEAPGFSLSVAAGSATFPGGSRTGCISVTPVNMDKVPMSPGFGQQPRFIVTIQPVGTTFNPPAAITIPNVDGLAPRAVTEMYSYDHDLASFVAIGSATVSDDGSIIKSDPGVGVLKAGWHCGGNPNQPGSGEVVHVAITTPAPVVVAKNKTTTVTATGGPQPGTFKWESSDKTIVVIQGSDSNSSVTVKAVASGTVNLKVRFTCHSVDQNGVHPFADASIEVRVAAVSSVKLEAIDSPLDTNPNTGGGLRIFPEKQTPTDTVDRKKVRVKATITPTEPNITVFFKSFDVDDPSTDAAPVDPNGSAGNDNRGTPQAGTLSAASATTDANGVATVEFTVTQQPGDNFKVAASTDSAYLDSLTIDGVNLVDSNSATLPTDQGKVTDMLTVWRKMHVEIDSMTAPGEKNFDDRIIASISGDGKVAQKIFTTIDIPTTEDTTGDGSSNRHDDSPTLPNGKGRFEKGSIRVGMAPGATTTDIDGNGVNFIQRNAGISIPFTISKGTLATATGNIVELSNTAGSGKADTFVLSITGGKLLADHNGGILTVAGINMNISAVDVTASTVKVSALLDIPIRIHDDDDDSVLPRDPLTDLMSDSDDVAKNLYAAAYIRPVFDGGGAAANNTHTVPFIRNTEDPKAYRWDSKGNNADDFWVVYILTAWQDSYQNLRCDRDPDGEGVAAGCPDGTQGSTHPAVAGSLIYIETIRDGASGAAGGAGDFERRVVAHEVGHAMGLDHGDGTDNTANNGIMNTLIKTGPTGGDLRFIDRHLNELRKLKRPISP